MERWKIGLEDNCLQDEENFENILIYAHIDNHASNKVIKKVGFKSTHVDKANRKIDDKTLVDVNSYIISRSK